VSAKSLRDGGFVSHVDGDGANGAGKVRGSLTAPQQSQVYAAFGGEPGAGCTDDSGATDKENLHVPSAESVSVKNQITASASESVAEWGQRRGDHGTGPGLATVQSVVADHHGTIAVEGGENGGARFVIDLPLAAGETAAWTERTSSTSTRSPSN
jgi:hypothetical protein